MLDAHAEELKQNMNDETDARLKEILSEYITEEGVDFSLFTGLDIQNLTLYGKVRMELSKKYPNPKELMEADDDTIHIERARHDEKAPLFLRVLDAVHSAYERVDVLQYLATEYEKKCIRFYTHLTRNWNNEEIPKKFRDAWRDTDLYETVESYFRILRKYGLHTKEEPYYFLSPKRRRSVKVSGDMLKRGTRIDDSEIHISILEDLL